jgi:hypothetical protein
MLSTDSCRPGGSTYGHLHSTNLWKSVAQVSKSDMLSNNKALQLLRLLRILFDFKRDTQQASLVEAGHRCCAKLL